MRASISLDEGPQAGVGILLQWVAEKEVYIKI